MSEKVKLPREVAEAIKECQSAGMSGISIVTSMEHVGKLFRDYHRSVLDALRVIKGYAQGIVNGGQTLLEALVNGYEVEETPEDLVRAKFIEWTKKCPSERYYYRVEGMLITLKALGIKIEGVNN